MTIEKFMLNPKRYSLISILFKGVFTRDREKRKELFASKLKYIEVEDKKIIYVVNKYPFRGKNLPKSIVIVPGIVKSKPYKDAGRKNVDVELIEDSGLIEKVTEILSKEGKVSFWKDESENRKSCHQLMKYLFPNRNYLEQLISKYKNEGEK